MGACCDTNLHEKNLLNSLMECQQEQGLTSDPEALELLSKIGSRSQLCKIVLGEVSTHNSTLSFESTTLEETLLCDDSMEMKRVKRDMVEIQEGVFYEGEWLNGAMDGYGVLQILRKSVYEGNFKDGQAHGQGSIIFENGDHYDGEWFRGQMDGRGQYVTAQGDKYDGLWKEDALLEVYSHKAKEHALKPLKRGKRQKCVNKDFN